MHNTLITCQPCDRSGSPTIKLLVSMVTVASLRTQFQPVSPGIHLISPSNTVFPRLLTSYHLVTPCSPGYAPSDEQGSEPSLKSELHFIEDVLKSTEHHYTDSRSPSVCSETVPVRDTRGHITGWKNGQLQSADRLQEILFYFMHIIHT